MVAIEKINEYNALLDKRSEMSKEIDNLMSACIKGNADIVELNLKINEYCELVNAIGSFEF